MEKYYEIEPENVLLLLNWSVILCYYLSHFRCLIKIEKPKTKIIRKLLENCISHTITSTKLENVWEKTTHRKTDKQIMKIIIYFRASFIVSFPWIVLNLCFSPVCIQKWVFELFRVDANSKIDSIKIISPFLNKKKTKKNF